MICPHCNATTSDEAAFCTCCGKAITAAPSADTTPSDDTVPSADTTPPDDTTSLADTVDDSNEATQDQTPETSSARRPHRKRLVAIVTGVLVLAAIGIAVFLFVILPTARKASLTDEIVLEKVEGLFQDETVSYSGSEWLPSEDLAYADSVISDITENPSDSETYIALIESTYTGSYVSATVSYEILFSQQDGEWQAAGYVPTEVLYSPTGSFPDDILVTATPTFMQTIDDDPYTDSDGKSVLLSDLYETNTDFSVLSNEIEPNGGSAEIAIYGMNGIVSYSGTITVAFSWDYSAGDWELESCYVSDDAYQMSYDGLIGTWQGALDSTNTNTGQACYGGREQPAILTVKSVDNRVGTAVVDVSFLVHTHEDIDGQDVESCSGDEFVTVNDVLITLKETGSIEILSGDTPSEYTVTLNIKSGGLSLVVETEYQSIIRYSEYVCWREDTFTLSLTDTE